MPTTQKQRDEIAKMKLIPVHELIQNKRLLLIDDSIVRGTQLKDTTDFLFKSGAKEVHVRPACPPLLYSCKYLNFSRSTTSMDLITRRVIKEMEGTAHPRTWSATRTRDLRVPEDGGDHRQAAALYHPALPQAGRHDGLCGYRQVQTVHLLLERQRVIPK